ncbi:MAG: PQQ-binding-like beta-propeller repeat protein [Myxococcota bacterium]
MSLSEAAFRRAWLSALCASVPLAVALAPEPAGARPVRVGRFARVPYGVSVAHPWPTGAGGGARRARALAAAPAQAPQRLWRERVGAGRAFSPALAEDGTLFVASQAGLAAVAPSGELRWALPLGLVAGTPSLTPDGSVAVGATPGEVVVVRAGRVVLRAPVGGVVRGSPLVLPDGSFVVAAWDQALHRFDAEGQRLFRVALPAGVRGAPARGPRGTLWVPAGSELVRVEADGRVRRRVDLGREIVNGPALADDGRAWVVLDEGLLVAVSPEGQPLVQRPLDMEPSAASNLAVAADGSLRVASASGALLGIGPGGSVRWRYEEGAPSGGVTVDPEGVTLTRDAGGQVLCISAEGQLRWRLPIEGGGDAAPVLGEDGTLFVAEASGALSAWR